MIPHLGVPELVLILALALIIFGPRKLPEVGKALGKTIKEFRGASATMFDQAQDATPEKSDGQKDNKGA